MIHISQNKRHNDGVGNDRWNGGSPFAFAKGIGTQGTEKRRKASEKHVQRHTAGNQIAQDTSHKQSGDCGRGEVRQNGKCLREADLNGVIRQSEGVGDQSQHNVECGGHSADGDDRYVFVFHIQFSFSFVLGEEGLELTGFWLPLPIEVTAF